MVGVMVDDTANVEWLRVQYDGKKKKSMQRFSDCLQSSGLPADYAVNGQLLQLMADEMRLEPKGQSMESEEAEQVQTVFLCLGTVRFESECPDESVCSELSLSVMVQRGPCSVIVDGATPRSR